MAVKYFVDTDILIYPRLNSRDQSRPRAQAADNTVAVVLYPEDLAPGHNYGAVRVVNPLTS